MHQGRWNTDEPTKGGKNQKPITSRILCIQCPPPSVEFQSRWCVFPWILFGNLPAYCYEDKAGWRAPSIQPKRISSSLPSVHCTECFNFLWVHLALVSLSVFLARPPIAFFFCLLCVGCVCVRSCANHYRRSLFLVCTVDMNDSNISYPNWRSRIIIENENR